MAYYLGSGRPESSFLLSQVSQRSSDRVCDQPYEAIDAAHNSIPQRLRADRDHFYLAVDVLHVGQGEVAGEDGDDDVIHPDITQDADVDVQGANSDVEGIVMDYITAATALGGQGLKLAADLAVGVGRGVGVVVGVSSRQKLGDIVDGGVEGPGGGKLGCRDGLESTVEGGVE